MVFRICKNDAHKVRSGSRDVLDLDLDLDLNLPPTNFWNVNHDADASIQPIALRPNIIMQACLEPASLPWFTLVI